MRIRLMVVATAALAAVLLAGCTGGSGDPATPPDETVITPETPEPPDLPETPEPPELPETPESLLPTGPPLLPTGPPVTPPAGPAPPVTAGEITISGQVVEGVEAGCLLLQSGAEMYLLILPRNMDRSALRTGRAATVRGRVELGMLTTCQQGTPFVVMEIRPA